MKNKLIIFLITIFIICPMCALAEETTTAASCSYATKANLNKLAANVDVSYEIDKSDESSVVFKISVYNIVDDIYISVENDYDENDFLITSGDANNGTYTFEVIDTTNIITYKFIVRSSIEGCTDDLRKITLVKPKKNKFYEYDVCKYDDVKDYSYCQEYVTTEFSLSDDKIIEKIKEQRNIAKVATTTSCDDCISNTRYEAKVELIEQYKLYATIGLSIGIALDLIFIYLKVSNIRRNEI